MFISESSIKQAIDLLSSVNHNFTRTTGNADLLSYFLILKKINISDTHWVEKSTLFGDSAKTLHTLWLLGGVFSQNETPLKKCCLLISSFSKRQNIKDSDFYNKGTEFKSLAGRVKDSVDNTAADYLLDKGRNDTYRLKSDVLKIVKDNYSSKFSLEAIVVWIYREYLFENKVSLDELKKTFAAEFNLSEDEIRKLFNTSNVLKLDWQDEAIDFTILRDYLGISKICEISKNVEAESYNFYKDTPSTFSIYNGIQMKNTPEKIKNLLEKNKQVILTGVPGTGKSYTINSLRNDYDEVKIIQFHQNYTYQDFIIGKTIKDGNIQIEKGALLEFVDSIEPEKNYLLVLDEINRGNISSIFGETLYALDRGNKIKLEKGYELLLPNNLHILGTMNTADRSIAIVDFAIRRRFLFIGLAPDYDLIDREVKIDDKEVLGSFLKRINEEIFDYFENSDYLLGHSYFLSIPIKSINDVYDILHYKIIPMLIEYAHGDKSSLSQIFPETLLKANADDLLAEIEDFLNE